MHAQNLAVDDALCAARDRFTEAMNQDLNSSGGLAVLFELAKPVRSLANRLERGEQVEDQDALKALHQRWLLLRELAAVLGLRHEPQQPIYNMDVPPGLLHAQCQSSGNQYCN